MAVLAAPPEQYARSEEAENRRLIMLELAQLRAQLNQVAGAGYSTSAADAHFVAKAGDTMTGDLVIGTSGTKLKHAATYPGFGVAIKPSGTIANNGTLDIGGSDMLGTALITADNAGAALAVLGGAVLGTSVTALRGTWSTTAGTSGTNVYWDSVANKYRIENKSGGNRVYYIVRFGNPVTM